MAFHDIALLAADGGFSNRVAACYATETLELADAIDPLAWSFAHRWEVAAAPGFGDAYASALAGGVVEDPGTDPSVISDDQILAAVQSIGVP